MNSCRKTQTYCFVCLIFLFILSFPNSVFSQVDTLRSIIFRGQVIDDENNKPIAGVHIYNSNQQGIVADDFGKFAFLAQKGDAFWFSALGYAKYMVFVCEKDVDECIVEIRLQPAIYSISAVDIFDTLSREEFRNAFIANQPTKDEVRVRENIEMTRKISKLENPAYNPEMLLRNGWHNLVHLKWIDLRCNKLYSDTLNSNKKKKKPDFDY